jgi:hypothetical protein
MTTFIAPKPDFLPYGMWVFSDGSEVIFNRQELPIWWRRGIGPLGIIAAEAWM